MGVYPTHQAQQIADDMNLDLVEIAPNATPPVCRIMDYGKFKYDQAIKAKQARKNQNKIEVKEMKFRPKIDVGDYTTKKKHVLRFLEAGNKVKITIMFRGREMAHPEQGLSILERLADDLKDVAVIENQPKMEGRNMHMLIAPRTTKERTTNAQDEDPSRYGQARPQDRYRQTHARQGVQEPYPHQEEPQAQAQLPPRDRGRQGGYQGRRAPARPSLVPFVFKE